MAWTVQPYTTRSDVKVLLDPTMSTTDDAFIDELITQAQGDLDSEIGYSFQQDGTVSVPATRLYDGSGDFSMQIDDLLSLATSASVIETSVVTYLLNGVVWTAGTPTTVDISADIILKPNNYVALGQPANKMTRNSGLIFAEGNQNYKVSGIFGQPIIAGQNYPGVPNDISRACARLTVHYYKMRDTAYADMVQAQGGVREKYTKDWPADVKRIAAKYAHTRFVTR